MKKKRIAQTPKDQIKKEYGAIRDKLKNSGYFDGRYNSKIFLSKKEKQFKYSKKKHLDEYLDLQDII